MKTLNKIIFFIFFYFSTAVFAVLSLPLLIFPRKYIQISLSIWSYTVSQLLYVLFKIDYIIDGEFKKKQVIFAIQHQSIWETIILANYLPKPLSIVMKRELISIPIIGYLFRKSGAIPINRGKHIQSIKALLKDTEKAINKGDNIIIYPQGTRVKPGENKPYLTGVFALYNHLKIPVVPIALNSGKFWYKFNLSGPGTIKVSILNEILPGLKKHEFMNTLQNLIENESEKLLK